VQWEIVSLLQATRDQVEKAKQAVRLVLGEEEPLTVEESAIAPAQEKSKTLPTIFVSYSHKDEQEKERLLIHLGVLRGAGLIDFWSDDRIVAGADWEREIYEAIGRARVAILLITANFLNSAFILEKEIPELLKRRESEDLTVFPVIARACAWRSVDWLTKMNVKPKNGRPIWSARGRRVDEDLTAIADEVAAIIKRET
jgi:hypothetical protein